MTFLKKIRFFVRLINAFVKKWFRVILGGIFLGILFYFLYPKVVKYFPKQKKVEKIGILGKYTIDDLPNNILQKISLGLTSVSPEGIIQPGLSSSWIIANDGKTYTFYFDKKHYWQDGSQFLPDDVNYNFKDAKILPIDFQTIKIKLDEPFSPFLSVISQPLFKKGLIGLGDYKISKVEKSGIILKSIFLVPSDRKSNLPNLIYRFYPSINNLKIAFKLGEVNKIEELDDLYDFRTWKNISSSITQSSFRQVVLFFNTKKDPFLDKNFRQAIAYAIEKDSGKKRAISPIPSLSWAFNPGVKRYEKDIEKTKLLLSKLKIDKNAIFSISTFPSLEKQAEFIKNQLEPVGIKCEIKITSFVPDDYDMFLAVQEIPKDPDQYSYWHTGQSSNISKFSNPRIDKLLEDGRKALSQEERKKIYFDFQRFLVEESPAVFLYYPSYYSIERK